MLITSREFKSKYYNGDDYTLNATDFNDNLAGSIMETKQATFDITVRVVSEAQTNLPFIIEAYTTSSGIITRSSGSYTADGFSIGDQIIVFWNDGTGAKSTTCYILDVNNDVITYDYDSGDTLVDYTDATASIVLNSDLPAFKLLYGMVENLDGVSYNSFIDDTTQGWYAEGMTVGGGAVAGQPLGENLNKSWINGSVSVSWLTKATGVFTYQVVHEFVIPYYEDGQYQNIVDSDIPDEFEGSKSYRYVGDFSFGRTLTNPSSFRSVFESKVLGAVGWYEEPYNGLNMPFSISNLVYEDISANVIDRIVADTDTVVKFTVTSADASFGSAGSTNTGVLVSKLPSLSQYQDKTNNFDTNWLYDSVYEITDTAATIGSPYVIQAYQSTFIDVNTITVEMTVNFPNVDDTDKYLVAFEVADDATTNTSSNKTILIVAADSFEKSADVTGLMTMNQMFFELYPDAVGTNNHTNIKGWVEDSINCNFEFELDTSLDAYLESLDAKIVAYNTVENTWFELESVPFPLQDGVVVSGVQTWNIDKERGFNIAKGDYNIVKLNNIASTPPVQEYEGQISLKIDWQEWLKLDDADTIFYDNTKEYDGLNEKASNYSLQNDYEIRVLLDAVVSNGDVDTNYVFSSPQNEIYDYELDDQVTSRWDAEIFTYDKNLTLLGKGILSEGTTTIKAVYTLISGSYIDETITISLEPIDAPSKNQIIINDTSILLSGADVIGSYELSPSLLEKGVTYKISSRLRCIEGVGNPFARMLNNVFDPSAGTFSYDLELLKANQINPLVIGDPVKITVKEGATTLEVVEGVYGGLLSGFTLAVGSPTPASSITDWISGSAINGDAIVFDKKSWADANTFDYQNGSLSGSNWISAAKNIDFYIEAYDNAEGLWSVNTDNTIELERAVNLVEGSIFTQIESFGQFYSYNMYDNDGLQSAYNSPNTYAVYENGVLMTSVLPTFTLTNYTWGTRNYNSTSRSITASARYLTTCGFTNGMVSQGECLLDASNQRFVMSYNRRLEVGSQIASTFTIVGEGSLSTTVVQRAVSTGYYYTGSPPASTVEVKKNGSILYPALAYISTPSATSGEVAFFNVDMDAVGQRNTIRYATTEGADTIFTEFQLELNYIY